MTEEKLESFLLAIEEGTGDVRVLADAFRDEGNDSFADWLSEHTLYRDGDVWTLSYPCSLDLTASTPHGIAKFGIPCDDQAVGFQLLTDRIRRAKQGTVDPDGLQQIRGSSSGHGIRCTASSSGHGIRCTGSAEVATVFSSQRPCDIEPEVDHGQQGD